MTMRKFVKILHTIAGLGFGGGMAAYIFILLAAPEITDISQHLVLRTSLAFVAKWLVLPSMIIAIVSGLIAMIVHHPFMNAPWVWAKALSGLLIFEATLASVDAPAQAAKRAAIAASNGEIGSVEMASLIRDEWTAWWILLALAVLNVIIGIWRPRFGIRRSPDS